MARSVFITGANRGIGLEFTKQFAEEGWTVYASCRNPKQAKTLAQLAKQFQTIHILQLDTSSETEVNNLSSQLANIPLDVVINNAGLLRNRDIKLADLNQKDLIDHFLVNSIAPLFVSRALVANLKLGKMKKIVSLSSILGSITENLNGSWNHYPYKASKAALNMLMSCLSSEPEFSEINFLLMQPGWVKTDMGGPNATLEQKDSVAGMRAVIVQKLRKRIMFIDYKGNEIPW